MSDKPVVYFAGALHGSRVTSGEISHMIGFLKRHGLTVLTEHIAEPNHRSAFARKVGKERHGLKPADIESQDLAWLNRATHVIAEVTDASTGTGREIEYARLKGRLGHVPAQILCLYRGNLAEQVSWMVLGMTPDRYPNVQVISYRSLIDGVLKISKFLNLHPDPKRRTTLDKGA